jgi:hypothetical protein
MKIHLHSLGDYRRFKGNYCLCLHGKSNPKFEGSKFFRKVGNNTRNCKKSMAARQTMQKIHYPLRQTLTAGKCKWLDVWFEIYRQYFVLARCAVLSVPACSHMQLSYIRRGVCALRSATPCPAREEHVWIQGTRGCHQNFHAKGHM